MTNRRLRTVTCGLMVLALAILAGCAINPVTGQNQLMLVSEQEERQLGLQTRESVGKEYGVYGDAALQGYVSGVAQPLARVSHRPTLDWHFEVMDSPVVNAFAAPGGYVFVTRGLLAAVNDEAELAGVLAHEIGHVTARHSAHQMSQAMLAGLGVQLGTALAGSYGNLLGPLLEAGTGLLFLKYSRDDERQADALGVEYATKAGYDTNRMADFFVTLQRQESLDGGKGGGVPEWFSTHPSPVDREASVRARRPSGVRASPPGAIGSSATPISAGSTDWFMARIRARGSVKGIGSTCRSISCNCAFPPNGPSSARGTRCRWPTRSRTGSSCSASRKGRSIRSPGPLSPR